VVMVDVTGADSNTLSRSLPGTDVYDAGAASSQLITQGDGYVEFTASETNTARALGLSVGAGPDGDPSLDGIGYAVRLSNIGRIAIHESGTPVMGPGENNTFGNYAAGDRLRLSVRDRLDGTADIVFSHIPASCAGPTCEGTELVVRGPAAYPFRVDATLRDQGATLTDVRIVRIQ
jgi:hypothetical protein